jgi:hypothetical protein
MTINDNVNNLDKPEGGWSNVHHHLHRLDDVALRFSHHHRRHLAAQLRSRDVLTRRFTFVC